MVYARGRDPRESAVRRLREVDVRSLCGNPRIPPYDVHGAVRSHRDRGRPLFGRAGVRVQPHIRVEAQAPVGGIRVVDIGARGAEVAVVRPHDVDEDRVGRGIHRDVGLLLGLRCHVVHVNVRGEAPSAVGGFREVHIVGPTPGVRPDDENLVPGVERQGRFRLGRAARVIVHPDGHGPGSTAICRLGEEDIGARHGVTPRREGDVHRAVDPHRERRLAALKAGRLIDLNGRAEIRRDGRGGDGRRQESHQGCSEDCGSGRDREHSACGQRARGMLSSHRGRSFRPPRFSRHYLIRMGRVSKPKPRRTNPRLAVPISSFRFGRYQPKCNGARARG